MKKLMSLSLVRAAPTTQMHIPRRRRGKHSCILLPLRGNKILSCLLAAALLLTSVSLAAEAAGEEEIGGEASPIAYQDIAEMVAAGSADYQKRLQEIEKQEISLAYMQTQYRDMMDNWQTSFFPTVRNLQDSIEATEKSIAEAKASLDIVAEQLSFPIRKLYWKHFSLLLDLAKAVRDLEAAENKASICRQKLSRGLAAQAELDTLEKNVSEQKKAAQNAQTVIDDNLKEIGKLLGLDRAVELGDIPEIDLARITDRDIEEDTAAYILSNPEAVSKEKAADSARETYRKSYSPVDEFAYRLAREELAEAREEAEKALPGIYRELCKAYEDYIQAEELTAAQEEHKKMETQFSAGLISKNKLESAAGAVLDAEVRHGRQLIQLWIMLMEYEFSLVKQV